MATKQPSRKAPPIVTTMRIPQDVLKAADERAEELDLSRTHYVVTLIERDTKRGRRARKDEGCEAPAENPDDSNIFG